MSVLDFYDEAELEGDAFARILLTGEAKAGKTTALLTTAPGPICVLNCDGFGAPMAAKRFGPKPLKILDVPTSDVWRRGVDAALKLAAEGQIKTIVVDTITMLINNVLTLEYNKKAQGFEIWRLVLDDGLRYLTKLLNAQAHVFVVSHFMLEDGQLAVNGNLKVQIPAMVHDRVHLEYRPNKEPARVFHVGPHATGLSGGRNSNENKVIPADATLLLRELGYNVD